MRLAQSPQTFKIIRFVLAAALLVGICVPHLPRAHSAYAGTTGFAQGEINVTYGEGDTIQGYWSENVLTVDDTWAYCVRVDDHFQEGVSASAIDPVEAGIWSQELCTELALIDDIAWSGDFMSTSQGGSAGHRVTSSVEKYAIAQCSIWKALNDAGFSDYGWFAVAVNGTPLTGTDTDAQIRDYVRSNRDLYVGHALYYDCGSHQDVACSFSLEPATGYLEINKTSSDAEFVADNNEYSLQGATYGVFQDESCEGEPVTSLVTDEEGHASSEAIQHGDYYVRETKASPGYELDKTVYPVTVEPGTTVLVNANAGCVVEVPQTGAVALSKGSAIKDTTSDNACYSREGAVYGIYSDEACQTLLAQMTTDKQGKASAEGLPLGMKYVKETTAPVGMALDETVYPVVVSAGKTSQVGGSGGVLDIPKSNPVDVLIAKYDGQKPFSDGGNQPQGAATLQNAEFTVEYYDGFYRSAADARQQGSAKRTWVFASDEQGLVKLDESYLLEGDALYHTSEGVPCLPLGTVVIQERKPPVGYLPNSTAYCVQITDDGGSDETVDTYSDPSVPDSVKRGDLELVKVGGTDMRRLDGVPFRITSLTTGESHVIATDANGYASTAASWNPHSQSTNANDSIWWDPSESPQTKEAETLEDAAQDELPDTDVIEVKGATTNPDEPDEIATLREQLHVDEADAADINENTDDDTAPNSDEPNDTTTADDETNPPTEKAGESIEDRIGAEDESAASKDESDGADENLSRSSSDVAMKSGPEPSATNTVEGGSDEPEGNTNPEDSSSDGLTKEQRGSVAKETVDAIEQAADRAAQEASPYDPDAGVWFGLGDDGEVSIPADDGRGALPYDTYRIEELPCPANEGLQLLDVSVVISKDNHVVDMGTLDDPQASIGTTARDGSDGDSMLACSENAVLVDKVNYANLVPGREYIVTGRLMNKDGSELLDEQGSGVSSTTTFVPESQTGYVELTFDLSTLQMQGASIVAFEQMTADGRVIASHEDLDDLDQSVQVANPALGTSAADETDGDGVISRSGEVHIVDHVSYSGLTPGIQYTLEGTIMDKARNEPLAIDDETVSARQDFVPESASGTVDMAFSFDATKLEDTTQLVVFERLVAQDGLVASHEDLQDAGQTITLVEPHVETTLVDAASGDKTVGLSGRTRLVDSIAYSGLVAGKEYTVQGILMDKEDGKPALDANGNPITAEGTFIPENEEGTVGMLFEFDGGNLAGRSLVAFESLILDDIEVAAHADLDDEAQTISVTQPAIATNTSNAATGAKTLEYGSLAQVTDQVHISGVTPGSEYTVVGVLMNKQTGMPLMASRSAGKDNQVGNTAAEAERMAKLWNEMLALANLKAPNPQENGALSLDKAVNLDYRAVGKMLEGYSNEFDHMVMQVDVAKADSSTLDLDIEFEFSTEDISGQVVVFEALLESGTGKLLALHADFGDADQTVEIPKPATPAEKRREAEAEAGTYDATGNLLSRYGWAFALVAAIGCAAGAYGVAKWRKGVR
ncbi:MAG: VaFE repeat-containing surface-anchored protein [Eggerthellaceae bacterium]|nr:VaFE repeat-containing surface-anchored protein [Eggerthellaceae bacterium]